MTTKRKTYCDLPVSGRRVEIQQISQWLTEAARQGVMEEIAAKGVEIPEAPTYEVEVFGGDKVRKTHTAATVKTDEDKAAWEAYETGQFVLTLAIGARVADVAIMEGVVGYEPTPEWESRMKALRLKIPTDPAEKRLGFIKATVINASEDAEALVKAIMKLSGIDAEGVARVRENFRSAMARQANR